MTIKLLAGDARDVLPTLAADSVHCVVTSPPYYGLRDYGTALWDGGDAACDHLGAPQRTRATLNANWGEGYADVKNAEARYPFKDTCGKCGARRIDRQIGLEASPSEYLATMVAVFREVRRVMRNDAVAFINMGDGYRDKQLLLMPARLALALQADGWWVRSAIVWAKPNPMPESCRDRPTSAYEMVYLLTKRATYYYDADAVREEATAYDHASRYAANPSHGATAIPGRGDNGARMTCGIAQPTTSRNLRNVWTIATSPFSAAHFATFPPELAERCIRAGTSERGCCAVCGAPWGRVTERPPIPDEAFNKARVSDDPSVKASPLHRSGKASGQKMQKWLDENPWQTTGWQPGCDHGAEVVPCRVLDCFAGAGTTLLVADRLQRDAIGVELNVDYTRMAMERCRADAPLFTSFPPAEPPEDERIADLFQDMAAE